VTTPAGSVTSTTDFTVSTRHARSVTEPEKAPGRAPPRQRCRHDDGMGSAASHQPAQVGSDTTKDAACATNWYRRGGRTHTDGSGASLLDLETCRPSRPGSFPPTRTQPGSISQSSSVRDATFLEAHSTHEFGASCFPPGRGTSAPDRKLSGTASMSSCDESDIFAARASARRRNRYRASSWVKAAPPFRSTGRSSARMRRLSL
jgi:hypothetical protein